MSSIRTDGIPTLPSIPTGDGLLSKTWESCLQGLTPWCTKLERKLRESFQAPEPRIQEVLDYILSLSGKRLRPALAFLSAGMAGGPNDATVQVATVVELVHTATLLHDDVLDDADQRRHRATVHRRWDQATSILAGDWLFAEAYRVASDGNSTFPGRCVAESAKVICQGELLQNFNIGRLDISEHDYLRILEAKTGQLCGISCRLGGWSAGAASAVQQTLAEYGILLGMAFQLHDDWLDYWGCAARTGKPLLKDWDSGKITMPLLRCMRFPAVGKALEQVFCPRSNVSREQLRALVDQTDASTYTEMLAQRYVCLAKSRLESLDECPARNSLAWLADMAVRRES